MKLGQNEVLDFLESLRIDHGRSENTIASYQRDLFQFLNWSQDHPDPSQGVREFLAHLHDLGQKPTSVARKVSALRQFFKFCCTEKGLGANPMEKVISPSLPKRLPKFLSNSEITALLQACQTGLSYPSKKKAALQARDQAMVYLLYATGLRVSELVQLQTYQIDFSLGYVRTFGKGDVERISPFATVASQKLKTYIDEFRHQLIAEESTENNKEWVFLNYQGERLSRQMFWKILKQLAILGEVTTPIYPHILRHSFATHLLQSGMNLRSLQMLLGHADLSTTQIYTHLTPEHLKEAHETFHPRGQLNNTSKPRRKP